MDDATPPNGRPIIASHAGVRGFSSKEYLLNLSDERIDQIGKCKGFIGVIFCDHWLVPPGTPESQRNIAAVINTIRYVGNRIGYDRVGIGLDLDGFIRPVHGLRNMSRVDHLRTAVSDEFPKHVEQILWQNAFDVLTRGWH